MPEPTNIATSSAAQPLQACEADSHVTRGTTLAQQGERKQAISLFREALRLQPDHVRAHHNLGVALAQEGNPVEALASFREALRLQPGYAEAHFSLGNTLGDLGRDKEAVAVYRDAVRCRPDFVDALHNLGVTLTRLGSADEAIVLLRHALRLRPDFPEGHNSLGLAHAEGGDFATAEACYERALELDPRYWDSLTNLGSAYKEQGKLEKAVASYDLALTLEPDSASTHWNRALAWLQMGNFDQGWPEYEWRWKRKGVVARSFPQPRWDGSPLEGRTILVHGEQGLGDMIQFLRYASLVKKRGGTVIAAVPAPLAGLFSTCPGVDRVVPESIEPPPFDLQVPLMSLPLLFKTTPATIPADVPYLAAEPTRLGHWRARLNAVPGFKVGITWQGNPRHKWDRHRSFPLALMEPLARVEGVSLVSLQKGPGEEQLPLLGNRFSVVELGPDFAGFRDTAAIMKCLDLVICCDTSVAHLAGALAVPVWVGLSTIVDWRWLLGHEDSPWYPTMRLFRQRRLGQWKSVFQRMAKGLRRLKVARDDKPLKRIAPLQSPSFKDAVVSVVIPCYNSGNWLARSVRSVLAQDVPGTEIIVVDDKSTDDSWAVAESLANHFREVQVIQQAVNTGPAAARNQGLRHARGRYVCFLDADDQYASGFFARVLPILQAKDELAWISTNIELANCHREVHSVQLDCMVNSLPSNLIIRKTAADLVGGFPEGPAYRGKGGEDIVFRTALARFFKGEHCSEKFLVYWVTRGSHFDCFLDRCTVVDGRLMFTSLMREEQGGELAAAKHRYLDQARERMLVLTSLRDLAGACPLVGNRFCEAVGAYEQLRSCFNEIEGFLHPQEGFALYHWARHGPGRGMVVEIGSLFGLSTCWLAAGTREAAREKIVTVDHFRSSPEHQNNGSHPINEIKQRGTTLPTFLANLESRELRAWVDVAVGGSVEIGSTWKGPIRLLFIDGDHSYETTRMDVKTWSKHVVPGGLIAFHDVEVLPGVTKQYRELLNEGSSWKEISKVRSLRIVQMQ